MKVIDCEQRSPEWYAARCGVPSASRFSDIVTTTGAISKSADKYMYQLAGEKASGIIQETYQSFAMQRGVELEAEARETYEFITGNKVDEIGFCLHDSGLFGASPDGMVGDDGSIEIKCPEVHTHIKYLLDKKLPTEYFQQMQGQLLVTGRKWCDFISYSQGLKPFIIRVYPDVEFLTKLESALIAFNEDLNEIVNKIA